MRSRSLLSLVAVTTTGCQIASLPPPSSRSDGGPVVARGMVSHEARSVVRFYQDASGCESVQTMNRQFRVVTVVDSGVPERLVIEESYDVRHCLSSEAASSEAVVTAWRSDARVMTPEFRINGRGTTGEPVGNLYRMTSRGCCGSGDLASYYSLLNGASLFTASQPPLRLEVANQPVVRFAGFHDTFSAATPPEAAADSTIIGVLQWGDDRVPARRVVVRSSRPEAYAMISLRFLVGGKPAPEGDFVVWPDKPAPDLAIEVRLVAPGSDRRVTFRVPIVDLELAAGRATVPAGIRLAGGG